VGFLAPALAAVAAFELVVLRAGTRTAIHIPALDVLSGPYRVVAWTGRYSYYLAAVLVTLALPVVAWRLWRRHGPAGRVVAGGLATFVVAAAAARAGAGDAIFLDMVMVALVALTALAAAIVRGPRGIAFTVFAAAFALAAAYVVVQDSVAAGVAGSYDGRWMLRTAEPMALAFAVSLPWVFAAGLGRREWTVGAIAGGLVLLLFLGEPFTARFLLLWNGGLPGTYPGAAYALAAGCTAASVAGLLRERRHIEAAAVVLLLAGGVGLHSTYQTGLVLIAFALLLAVGRPAVNPVLARSA